MAAAAMAAPAIAVQPEVVVAPAGELAGNLQDREIMILRNACLSRHDDNGALISKVLTVAAFVAAVLQVLQLLDLQDLSLDL